MFFVGHGVLIRNLQNNFGLGDADSIPHFFFMGVADSDPQFFLNNGGVRCTRVMQTPICISFNDGSESATPGLLHQWVLRTPIRNFSLTTDWNPSHPKENSGLESAAPEPLHPETSISFDPKKRLIILDELWKQH